MSDAIFSLERGGAPLVLSLPHVGTEIPDEVARTLVPRALAVEDTDWHLAEAYDFGRALGASVLVPRLSRYVVDLNRPPENTPMYAGANNTELVPTRFFTGDPLYRDGIVPDEREIERRRETYWRPYHDALAAELARVVAAHGHVVLWEGHSIQAEVPWLFEGRLADLNLGTAGGTSCAPSLRTALMAVLAGQSSFSHVTDGRFKGGYITREYGRPHARVHAVQLEMALSTYMDETRAAQPVAPADPARLARLRPVLRQLLEATLAWRPDGR
jgi:N-formylglutamate deformylase